MSAPPQETAATRALESGCLLIYTEDHAGSMAAVSSLSRITELDVRQAGKFRIAQVVVDFAKAAT